MEEKVLIKSKPCDVKKVLKVMVIIGIVLAVLNSIMCISDSSNYYTDHEHEKWCYKYEYKDEYWTDYLDGNIQESKMNCFNVEYDNAFLYAMTEYLSLQLWLCLIPVAVFALIGGLIYLWLRSYELTVTDKRIYGKVAWGKRVDLPVDSVSATATIRLFKGVSVSTSSGRISFCAIKNADEIYTAMSRLLIKRQQKKTNIPVVPATPSPVVDVTDQLKKYKELLDSGVITQEEFDAKKKQLLGL